MKNQKISIIIVSLNTRVDFIKTLSSIKKQNYHNYEIIVIDGNSIDGTKEEIMKRKAIISKFIIEKDKGIYHAMNKGIKISSGKWTIFMNSGDIFYKKNTLKNFISKDNQYHDIIYGDTLVDAKSIQYVVKSKVFDTSTILMPFCHQSVFVKSFLLKKRNFSLGYKYSSDFDFFNYCFLKGKKFKKADYIISKVKSGGFADKNRQKVFDENLQIVGKRAIKNLIYLLYLKKVNQFLKDFLKMLIPNTFQLFILKLKYKNNLID
jgi:glycosyltransferase involved in cell wall biosynthesis